MEVVAVPDTMPENVVPAGALGRPSLPSSFLRGQDRKCIKKYAPSLDKLLVVYSGRPRVIGSVPAASEGLGIGAIEMGTDTA